MSLVQKQPEIVNVTEITKQEKPSIFNYNDQRSKHYRRAKRKADKLNLNILPSCRKHKKLAIILNGKIVAHIGDDRYEDYNIHQNTKRRDIYKKCAEKNRHKLGSVTYYTDQILW